MDDFYMFFAFYGQGVYGASGGGRSIPSAPEKSTSPDIFTENADYYYNEFFKTTKEAVKP